MTLGTLLAEAAERWGDSPFLVDHNLPCSPTANPTSTTYAMFDRRVNGLAFHLNALGVGHGDRVAVIVPSGWELLYIWFALAKLGAVLVPLNPALTQIETQELLYHAGPTLLIATADKVAAHGHMATLRATVVVAEPPGNDLIRLESLLAPEDAPPRGDVSARDPLTILYTSGTTGRPKGCILTHETYTTPARAFHEWMDVTPGDRFFVCLPLFHMAGQSFTASAVAAGASIVVVEKFSASRFWDQVARVEATVFRHLGEMLAVLNGQPPHPLERAHNLRAVYGGGARPDVLHQFERRFGAPVIEGYGLTETNTVLRNEISHRRIGSIGRALPYSDVRVADEEGRKLPPGEVGEIQVRRNAVMLTEYFCNPEASAAAFQGDWYRTGDLGSCDADGYFYFIGRRKEIIRRRGENIAPMEIEEVLNRHPAVAHSAVVGIPDEVGGEETKAFIIAHLDISLTVDALVKWCRASLAEFKVPRHFEFCDDLPRTATNKINKGLLRSMGTVGGRCYQVHN